jgi:hypothetical protein
VVLQDAVSLARVSEDPSDRLILVEWRDWGSGGELLEEGRARHRLGRCPPFGGSIDRPRVRCRSRSRGRSAPFPLLLLQPPKVPQLKVHPLLVTTICGVASRVAS